MDHHFFSHDRSYIDFQRPKSESDQLIDYHLDLENTEENSGLINDAEINPEKEAAVENAKESRARLFEQVVVNQLNKALDSPFFNKCLNYLPGAGDAKMLYGAIAGREYGSKTGIEQGLSPGERMNYALAAATGILVLGFVLNGDYGNALAGEGFSNIITKFDHILAIVKSSARLLDKNDFSKTSHFIETMVDFVLNRRDDVARVLAGMFKKFVPVSSTY